MFRPSKPSPRRLLRLGVVLDTRNAPERARMIARMCELAGIDALWVRDGLTDTADNAMDVWQALLLAARETRTTRLGAMVDLATRGLDRVQDVVLSAAQTADMAGRLEITLCGDRSSLEAAQRLRDSGPNAAIVGLEVHTLDDMQTAARVADDVLLPSAIREGRVQVGALVTELAAVCAANGRQPSSLGVAVQLPISIGRTETEAQARMASEALFAGDGNPATSGIFGTLEMCQDRVIELAHAGVTDLRCVLPNSPDVHDVIAQLTAMVIGSVDVLQPGAPRSKAPDAPTAWGGRPRFPT